MTTEDRNIKLKHLITCMKCEASGKVCDASCPIQYAAGNMGEIIENLEAISKILEQQPCEDCISRQAVIEITAETGALETQSGVRELPSVTPKEKTGHWIMEDMFDGDVAYRCSECNELFWIESGTPKDNEYNFCPNCGARMVSE